MPIRKTKRSKPKARPRKKSLRRYKHQTRILVMAHQQLESCLLRPLSRLSL